MNEPTEKWGAEGMSSLYEPDEAAMRLAVENVNGLYLDRMRESPREKSGLLIIGFDMSETDWLIAALRLLRPIADDPVVDTLYDQLIRIRATIPLPTTER